MEIILRLRKQLHSLSNSLTVIWVSVELVQQNLNNRDLEQAEIHLWCLIQGSHQAKSIISNIEKLLSQDHDGMDLPGRSSPADSPNK